MLHTKRLSSNAMALLLLILLFVIPLPSHAAYVYTYTGNPFTGGTLSPPCGDNLMMQLTVQTPITANYTAYIDETLSPSALLTIVTGTVTPFTQTLSLTKVMIYATGSNGQPTSWYIDTGGIPYGNESIWF